MRTALPISSAVGRTFSISPLKTRSSISLFDLVIQLVAVGAEKLDAVVGVGIVRGRDDDAGVGAQAARDVSDARVGSGPMNTTSTPIERMPETIAFSSM